MHDFFSDVVQLQVPVQFFFVILFITFFNFSIWKIPKQHCCTFRLYQVTKLVFNLVLWSITYYFVFTYSIFWLIKSFQDVWKIFPNCISRGDAAKVVVTFFLFSKKYFIFLWRDNASNSVDFSSVFDWLGLN
jgi:hypothetical protein